MKKTIIFIFFFIFIQNSNAEKIVEGPKTIEDAKKLFFENRELDSIEGIWYNDSEKSYYAIVRDKNIKYQKLYDMWTIIHRVDEFSGKKDPNLIYILSGRYPDKSEYYTCSNTIYNLNNPSEQGKADGICNLNSAHNFIVEKWEKGCWSENRCWSPMRVELEMVWPRNYKKHQMYKKIGIWAFFALLLFIVLIIIKLNRNKKLLEYNQKHKKKFNTYSELNNHLKKVREKEWKKFEKKQEKEWELKRKKEEAEIKAEEAKIEKEAKAEEARIRAEERKLEREEKRKESIDYIETEDEYDNSLMNKVKRLKRLYKNGTLSKAEFEKAKNKLLK